MARILAQNGHHQLKALSIPNFNGHYLLMQVPKNDHKDTGKAFAWCSRRIWIKQMVDDIHIVSNKYKQFDHIRGETVCAY